MPFAVKGECQRSESRIASYLSHDEGGYHKLQTTSETMRENETKGSGTGPKGTEVQKYIGRNVARRMTLTGIQDPSMASRKRLRAQ